MLIESSSRVTQRRLRRRPTDVVFVVTAVLFNLVVLGINWGVASEANNPEQASGGNDLILAVLIAATLMINFFAFRALSAGSRSRAKLIGGLAAMYKDDGIDKYYDPSLLDTYGARYKMFTAVLGILVAISILVPLLERVLG
jgi:hypothetical protein